MTKNVRTHLFKQLSILAMLCLQVPLLSCGSKNGSNSTEPPPQPPPTPVEKPLYKKGEILLIEVEKDYKYFAEVTADTKAYATQIPIQFFVEDIHEEIGTKIPVSTVATKREKPKNGWGSQKILLQYFDGNQWILSEDATMFEDYYLLPESVEGERKVSLNRVRIPIFKKKHAE